MILAAILATLVLAALLITAATLATRPASKPPRTEPHPQEKPTNPNTNNNLTPNRYTARPSLCTTAELHFYEALRTAFPDQQIMTQVRLADIITPAATQNQSHRTTALNSILPKSVDFAVCNPKSLSVLAIFELDDASHTNRNRRQTDQIKDAAIKSAEIPLHRIPTATTYDPKHLRSLLAIDIQTQPT